jgi:hypothetical protein
MITRDTGARADALGQNNGNRVTAHRERTVGNKPRTGPYVYLIRGLSPIPLPSYFSLVFGILVNRTSCSDQTPVAVGNVNSDPLKPTVNNL